MLGHCTQEILLRSERRVHWRSSETKQKDDEKECNNDIQNDICFGITVIIEHEHVDIPFCYQ
jgi:hypothetical protein